MMMQLNVNFCTKSRRTIVFTLTTLPMSTGVVLFSRTLFHFKQGWGLAVVIASAVSAMIGWLSILSFPTCVMCDDDY